MICFHNAYGRFKVHVARRNFAFSPSFANRIYCFIYIRFLICVQTEHICFRTKMSIVAWAGHPDFLLGLGVVNSGGFKQRNPRLCRGINVSRCFLW
jgi:hypothetical protein